MADTKISDLDAAVSVADSDLIVVANPSTGAMKKATFSQLPLAGLFNQTSTVLLEADGTGVKDPKGTGIGSFQLPANTLTPGALYRIRHIFNPESGAADQDFTYKLRETSGDDMALLSISGGLFASYPLFEIETLILCKSVASNIATLSVRTVISGTAIDSGFEDFEAATNANHNLSLEVQFAGDGDGQNMESMVLLFERLF